MLLLSATLLALASATSLLGCPSNCGDIIIPYPFGIGTGCYRDGFEITCDTTDKNNIFPTLAGTSIHILDLSLELSEVRVEFPIGWQCFNESGLEDSFLPEVNFNPKGVYRISNTHNQFVVIGCNSLAWIRSKKDGNGVYSYSYYTGCLSYCNNSKSVTGESSCSGIGCCQVAIPSGLTDNSVNFGGYPHDGDLLSYRPCSYAFLVDKDWFRFGKSNLTMSKNTTTPVLLDWAFREANSCAEAQLDSKIYGCRSKNSLCYDSSNGPGYLCTCSKGYGGNPYRVNGCVDIDECKLPNLYRCNGICHNKPGSYDCMCPQGKYGEPFNGSCIPTVTLGTRLAIGISVGLVIVLVIIFAVLYICQKRRLQRERDAFFKKNGGFILYEKLISREVETMKIFTREDLVKITNNYETIIGRGGRGKVYKGLLEDNRTVAVKTSIIVGESEKEEFVTEMIILSQVNHKNIVRLFGCCLEVEVPMLAYEFISNGTLYGFLHANQSRIDLETRIRIGVESAEALAYLHYSTARCILHGDVKSANILLNETFTVKVSDFGTSRFLSMNVTQFATLVQGTYGYLDPEFLQNQQLTEKSDVYSFGVVLLELLTRKKALYGEREKKCLALAFVSAMKENNITNMSDPDIATEDCDLDLLKEVGKLAVECLALSRHERPTMTEVAERLRKVQKTLRQSIKATQESFLQPSNSFSGQGLDHVRSETI